MILNIANFKGGIGKTSLCLNLSHAIALRGKKVLVIDFDPSMNLTTSLGLRNAPNTMYDITKKEVTLQEVIIKRAKNLYVVPGNINLAIYEMSDEEIDIQYLMAELQLVKSQYDYILIDNKPSIGDLMFASMSIAEGVIAPVLLDSYAIESLDIFEDHFKSINPELDYKIVIPTKSNQRKIIGQTVYEVIKEKYPISKTVIRQDVAIEESPMAGQTIFEYQSKSRGADDYKALAKEFITIMEK